MSNQQPWTLLQVGDKVVFKPSTGTTNENIFTITSISHRGYSGTWSGMNFGPLSMDGGLDGSAWWVNKLRVEKPWYRQLAVGDTFKSCTGCVYTVVQVGDGKIEAVWKDEAYIRTRRGSFTLEDSWLTDPTKATPIHIAALQPPTALTPPQEPEVPWYRRLAKGDTFTKEGMEWLVTASAASRGGVVWVSTPERCGNRPIHPCNQAKWFSDASPLSVAALKVPQVAPWWHSAKPGDRFHSSLYGNCTVASVLMSAHPNLFPREIAVTQDDYPKETPLLRFHVRADGKFEALDQATPILPKTAEPIPYPAWPDSPWMDLEVGSPIFLDTLSPCIISKAEWEAGSAEKLGYYHASVSIDYLVAVVEAGVKPHWWGGHCRQMEKRPWMGLKTGDRLKLKDGNVAKVEQIHRFPSYPTNASNDVEVKFSIEGSGLSTSYYYRADGSLRPDWWVEIAQVNPTPPTPYSPSPGDRCYVDGSVWEVTEANLRLGMDNFWQLRMKRLYSKHNQTWCPVQSTTWCQHNLVPPSHWSRNLKVGDRLLEGDDEGDLIWTVEALADDDRYILGNAFYPKRTLCPIIDRNWFSKAKLLPRVDPLPNTPPSPLLAGVATYPRHRVPTIPLDDLAVGEAVDVPVERYSEDMIRGIVELTGKRAEAGSRKIFGLVSTETTHTIWREM